MKKGYIYILASKRNGTLYIGVTSNIEKRLWQHQQKALGGFTSKYGVKHMVHMEEYGSISEAIQREKNLKRWRRSWKIDLIESQNPNWLDLETGERLER